MFDEALADKGRGRAGRGGDHRNQARADGIAQVDAEQQDQGGRDHDAAAQARERAEQTRQHGDDENQSRELQNIHVTDILAAGTGFGGAAFNPEGTLADTGTE